MPDEPAAAAGAVRAEHAGRRRSPSAPRATYRLQVHRDFPLARAAELADYLAALGVSHVYTSPILQAAPGSEHGYDGTDPTRVDAERGGEAGVRRFREALARCGLGHVLDIVPNHMATTTTGNRWWWDVLRRGRASPFARFFDVDWEQAPPVRVPILGEPLEEAVAKGDLRAEAGPDGPVLRYHEHVLPLDLDPEGRGAGGADPAALSPAELLALLERQPHRPVWWREAQERIDYRRFFDIAGLIGVRVEDPEVFAATHALVLRWVREGHVDGLRIDHPDGLRNPRAYLARLAEEAAGTWIVVEKILEREERLRSDWPVDGTTGYEFLVRVGGLFVDPAGEPALTRGYQAFVEAEETWEEVAFAKKRLVLHALFRPELARLERALLACQAPSARDPGPESLCEALAELLPSLSIYRTYVEPDAQRVAPADVRAIEGAAERVRARRPDLAAAVDFVCEVLCLRAGLAEPRAEFVARFQQATGPLMAKGVEDTAFYSYGRLVALNEVGGDPSHFHVAPAEFHADARRRQRSEPLAMLATSTHDTKRSEDVRARLFLLSEIPERWTGAVQRWRRHNERHRSGDAPDRHLEYLLYQTFVGAHPLPVERARDYAVKAMREAKRRTSWIDVDPDYEAAVLRFVEGVLADPVFQRELEAFVAPLVGPGRVNALSQTLLKLAAPGVPDLYQGTELWDLSLVDPDNRRPVDWALRRRLLDGLVPDTAPEAILAESDAGLPKLWLIRRALALRRREAAAFGRGAGYAPLEARGAEPQRLVAFARSADGEARVVAAAPRLQLGMPGGWGDTSLPLPEGRFTNVLTHETGLSGAVAVARLLARFPVALLARE